MSEHDKIRERLALAAAGALDDDAERERLRGHLSECVECAQELEGWNALAGGLRRLPTPRPSAALVERTRARMVARLAAESERRWNVSMLVFAVLFAWTLTLAGSLTPIRPRTTATCRRRFGAAPSGPFSLLISGGPGCPG